VAYTKLKAASDKITIEGTDVSNSFRNFRFNSEHAVLDATGFSSTGNQETVPGATTQSFEGEAFYTEELGAIVQPAHAARTVVTITWQPNGLVDSSREIYSGECYILTYSPESTVGDVYTFPFVATAADANGIAVNNWT